MSQCITTWDALSFLVKLRLTELLFIGAQLDPRQETCKTSCLWCPDHPTVYGWAPIYPSTTIIVATIITSIDTINHVTTTTVISNELPSGYKLPPTNSLGTRIVDASNYGGTGLMLVNKYS
jgi:hypothetical protein